MASLSSSYPTPLGKPLLRNPNFPHKSKLLTFAVSATTSTRSQHFQTDMTMYELLAVESTAGPEEIRAAYRRQARQWHPDACSSSAEEDKRIFAERFMAARRAYELLSDPARRREYDLAHLHGYSRAATAFACGLGVWQQSNRGFSDWEAQLEGLKRRAKSRKANSG